MLMPKKTKYRKAFKGRIHGQAVRGNSLSFGTYGLQALEPDRITARQLEAARRAIVRHMKRMGRMWIRVYPHTPVTSKPAEVRMGSGKGSVDFWACRVKPGQILIEVNSPTPELAKEALALAGRKLPIGTRFFERSMRGDI